MNNRILLVDDDQELLAALELKLDKEGFQVETAPDGEVALEIIKKKLPDLVILDVNMPKVNGMEVCKTLRSDEQTRDLAVIMLTARDDEIDRVLGLEFGADDYVTKPYNARELILRIKALLKRIFPVQNNPATKDIFQIGALSIDMDKHEVRIGEEVVELTLTEFKLLAHLIQNQGKIKTRDFLLEQIWEYGDGVFSRTIDTHIQRLRAKLGDTGKYIKTVRGVGYRFEKDD
ncbi:MAG: two-component system alkaline phosphatase synthesis response regulator PhoP [Nitrospinales bacterium]|jgi:two-component system alkaline phosphatase synthesis response regulator PhoP